MDCRPAPRLLHATLLICGLFHALAAQAATCRTIAYYATARQTDVVGTWSRCPGKKGLTGRRSRFSASETEELPIEHQPGSLPCELQARCEINLPKPIVVEPPRKRPKLPTHWPLPE